MQTARALTYRILEQAESPPKGERQMSVLTFGPWRCHPAMMRHPKKWTHPEMNTQCKSGKLPILSPRW